MAFYRDQHVMYIYMYIHAYINADRSKIFGADLQCRFMFSLHNFPQISKLHWLCKMYVEQAMNFFSTLSALFIKIVVVLSALCYFHMNLKCISSVQTYTFPFVKSNTISEESWDILHTKYLLMRNIIGIFCLEHRLNKEIVVMQYFHS